MRLIRSNREWSSRERDNARDRTYLDLAAVMADVFADFADGAAIHDRLMTHVTCSRFPEHLDPETVILELSLRLQI